MPRIQANAERSKIRILFVEGDFAPGDFHELTHALSNAIRPAPFFARVALPARPGAMQGEAHKSDIPAESADDLSLADDLGADVPPDTAGFTKGPARPRSYRKPRPVDMDMAAGGKPFKEFADEKGPTAHRAKYLVAAAWLHDYAKTETITADHVFTCYKAADWNFDIADTTVTFRQLKADGLGTLKRGNFSVNHLGLAQVKAMSASD